MGTFNTMQSVRIQNPELEMHDKAGYVVKSVNDFDGKTPVEVKMDADNTVYEFAQADVQPL